MQRRAVSDSGEQTHHLGRRHRLDVHSLQVVKHDQVGGLAGCFGQCAEKWPCAKAQLAETGATLGKCRQLGARVVTAGLGVLADVAAPKERCEQPVHGADVQPGPRRERRDRDLALGRNERLE